MIENITNSPIIQYNYFSIGQKTHPQESIDYTQTITTLVDTSNIYSEKDFNSTNSIDDKIKVFDEKQIEQLAKDGLNVEDIPLNEYKSLISDDDNEEMVEDKALRDKIKRLKEHTDGMYKTAMNDNIVTINSLYIGSFSMAKNNTSNDFTKLDATTVLGLNNLPITSGNTWAAQKLMNIGEDVSPSNISKMQNIYNAIESMELPADDDELSALEQATKTIIEEEKVMYTEKDMQDIVDTITKIDELDIDKMVAQDEPITINKIKESLYKNTQKALGEVKTENATTLTEMIDPPSKNVDKIESVVDIKQPQHKDIKEKVKEIKEQIDLIRANLTVQAARNISQKMPLESTELSKIALELTAHREKQIETALENINLEATDENKQTLENVLSTVTRMKYNKEASLVIQTSTFETATLSEFDKNLKTASSNKIIDFNEIIQKYSEQELTPETRFGENILKVQSQIKAVLRINHLPTTDLSIQAATALIVNGEEITKQNLEQTMEIANKMNTFLDEMTPNAVANMIKEGINPYYQTIDDALNFISDKNLPNLQKSIAEAIVALEEKGEINQAQKQELIGLYQILNSVSKNKEKVIGYLQKNNLPLTVNRLQEAVKYVIPSENIQKYGGIANIDAKIDDLFGEIDGYKIEGDTAKQKIETAHEENKKLLDALKIVENSKLSQNTSQPDIATKIGSMIYPFVKSAVKKELGKFSKIDTLPDSFKEKMEVAKNAPPETINALSEKNIPITINNIYLMQKYIDSPETFGELLQQEIEKMQERLQIEEFFPETFKNLEEEFQDAIDKSQEDKENAMMQGDTITYKENKQIEEMTSFLKKTNGTDGMYQIPFIIGGEAKLVNLYVHDGSGSNSVEKDELQAVISYDTKHLGTIVANLKITKDALKYEISAKTDDLTKKLQNKDNELGKLIEAIGYKVKEAIYLDQQNYTSEKEQHTMQAKLNDSIFEEVV
ncbi:hypothetical protein AN641_06605 [Candidatus Epulonipiscioides gigas]|nr:hypothetical protein AN641_06605 [Epulopiscium sp. SCG-C07WGA-EpuloA2]